MTERKPTPVTKASTVHRNGPTHLAAKRRRPPVRATSRPYPFRLVAPMMLLPLATPAVAAEAAAIGAAGGAGTSTGLLTIGLAALFGGGATLLALLAGRTRPRPPEDVGASPPGETDPETTDGDDKMVDAAGLLERVLGDRGIGGVAFLPTEPAPDTPDDADRSAFAPSLFGSCRDGIAEKIAGIGVAAPDATGTDPLRSAVSRLLAEGRPFETTLVDGDATVQVSGTLDGLVPVVVATPRQTLAVGGSAEAGLLDLFPHPAWRRRADGRLLWANAAFRAAATGSTDGTNDITALFGRDGTTRLETVTNDRKRAREPSGPAPPLRITAVAGGRRRTFDVVERAAGDGAVIGVAIDVTELDEAYRRLSRTVAEQAATFDRLATAVAIFGPDRRLSFHNAAYRSLWQLDETFLGESPTDETVLDRLRTARRLPETADFRAFKRQATRGYQSVESLEQWWHLPDGRTLRVVASPNPEGGVTYIYENLTEQLALEARFNALTRTQAETIDNLKEGVATFGPDGLAQLSNPAFARLWNMADGRELVGRHVTDIAAEIAGTNEEKAAWGTLAAAVTGLADQRSTLSGRVDRAGGRTLDYASVPLPDGSNLITFVDVTDTVRVARALSERNQALEEADRLKNAFIEHISYELRSPLTSIIGFTQMLAGGTAGELNDRQRDYAGYISRSSQALLVMIDDVLDLATIDAGIMTLDVGTVDIEATLAAGAEALQDRIREAGLTLHIDIAPDARTFEADERRLRQILYNVLSNAVAHSDRGAAIHVTARAVTGKDGADEIAIGIRDEGVGIPPAKAETVFERFEADASRGRHRGVGLGLALVKSFAELHGGRVSLASTEGVGTEVSVVLPRKAAIATVEPAEATSVVETGTAETAV